MNESGDSNTTAGLIPGQEIIVVDVQSNDPEALQTRIAETLAEKPAHRIVTTTMASFGEFPLYFRILIVIEFV